jgi:hypothetical protein
MQSASLYVSEHTVCRDTPVPRRRTAAVSFAAIVIPAACMATIYRKTPDGQAEIETRARRLGPRLRTALIMVDGKRSDEDLRKLIAQEADETLQALLSQGLIEVVAITQPRPARVAPAAPATLPPTEPAAAAAPIRDLNTVRREAVRAVNDLLGPMGEMLAIKLEQAKNGAELQAALERAVTVIGNARGGGAAAQFARQFIQAPRS